MPKMRKTFRLRDCVGKRSNIVSATYSKRQNSCYLHGMLPKEKVVDMPNARSYLSHSCSSLLLVVTDSIFKCYSCLGYRLSELSAKHRMSPRSLEEFYSFLDGKLHSFCASVIMNAFVVFFESFSGFYV